jgi:flagellar assembly factor FliW
LKLQTRLFGAIDWDESSVIHFPEGLLGFESCRRFLLIDDESVAPFRWLQCITQPDLAFAVIEPRIFLANYRVQLSAAAAAIVDHDAESQPLILTIAVLSRDPHHITVNLAGPLVVNARTRTGVQAVLDSRRCNARYSVYDDLMRTARSVSSTGRDHSAPRPASPIKA